MGIVAAAKALWDALALRACSVPTAWLLSLIFALMAVPQFDAIQEGPSLSHGHQPADAEVRPHMPFR